MAFLLPLLGEFAIVGSEVAVTTTEATSLSAQFYGSVAAVDTVIGEATGIGGIATAGVGATQAAAGSYVTEKTNEYLQQNEASKIFLDFVKSGSFFTEDIDTFMQRTGKLKSVTRTNPVQTPREQQYTQKVSAIMKNIKNGVKDTSVPIINNLVTPIDTINLDIKNLPVIKEKKSPEELALQVSEYLIKNHQYTNNADVPQLAGVHLALENPHLLDVMYAIINYELGPGFDINKQNGFNEQQIRLIYDGKGIGPESMYEKVIDGKLVWACLDETGREDAYTDTRGPLPAIWGIYVGPLSPNNFRGKDLLDFYSFQHDVGFQNNGYFDPNSDLEFLSRISQNYDRMASGERIMAKFCYTYFSTIGLQLGRLKGSLKNPLKDNSGSVNDDLYSKIVGKSSSIVEEGRINLNAGIDNFEHGNDSVIFYNLLKNSTDSYFSHNAPTGQAYTKQVRNILDDLIITELN